MDHRHKNVATFLEALTSANKLFMEIEPSNNAFQNYLQTFRWAFFIVSENDKTVSFTSMASNLNFCAKNYQNCSLYCFWGAPQNCLGLKPIVRLFWWFQNSMISKLELTPLKIEKWIWKVLKIGILLWRIKVFVNWWRKDLGLPEKIEMEVSSWHAHITVLDRSITRPWFWWWWSRKIVGRSLAAQVCFS